MTIYLVRHAKAGDRSAWVGEDELRPLSGRGHLQARNLIELLADARFERVLSSPYVRCMETVVPIAAARGLPVEPCDGLAEGASLEAALAVVGKHAASGAVLCTHGDVMPMLLEHAQRHGVDLGPVPQCPKGCTWVLETDESGAIVSARYLPPPN